MGLAVETNLARVECWGGLFRLLSSQTELPCWATWGLGQYTLFHLCSKGTLVLLSLLIYFFFFLPFCSSHGLIFIIFVIYVRSVSFYSFFRSNEIYCQWILRSRFLFRFISKTMTSERERFSRKIAFVPMHYTSRRFSERSHFCSVSLSRYMNVSGREQISRSRTSFSRFPS